MPFLLGAFGAHCTSDLMKKISQIASRQAAEGDLQTMSLEHGIIFTGDKPEETYRYDNIMPLPADQGVLVGKLFDRDHDNPANLTTEQIQACIDNPQKMSNLFWGRYIGILYNKVTKTVTLVRDPQGLSTIFYSVMSGGIIFATELALLYEALETKPAINLNYFGQHLVHANHALSATPFEGIEELLPGMGLRVNFRGECSHDLLWDVSSLHGSLITDANSFEEELLATLKSCTNAWVGDAPGVCVELSGGTDSSGLMLLLHDILPANKKLMAVNFIDSKTQSSNEIEYAQEIADICNAPLHFLDWQTTSLLDNLPQGFLPNRPSTLLLFHNLHKQLDDLALQNNCPVRMNGQGGDHVFLAPQPKAAVADYWLDCGMRGITAPLKELCGVYRMPLPKLVYENTKALVSYYRGARYKGQTEHIETPHLAKNFEQELKHEVFFLNPILKRMHPGKATQIESLCHAVSYSERNQTMPNRCTIHPLLSQPVIELGLRIPTYQSFHDGYDRIFFRRAVSRLQKTKSLWRRIKGQTTGSIVKDCARNAHEIRDIILNGKIAASGMLDKQWLDKELAKMQHGSVENLWPILHCLTGQLWLNQWKL